MFNALDAEMVTQMLHLCRLVSRSFYRRRFGRRHLAYPRCNDSILPPGNCRDVHIGVVFLQIDMAMAFAKRSLWFEVLGIDKTFNHHLRFGWNH